MLNVKFISPLVPFLIVLESFTLFPEYFLTICLIYLLVVITLLTYSVYGLMLQKTVSECIAIILLMTCYLIYNDDLVHSSLIIMPFYGSVINDYLYSSITNRTYELYYPYIITLISYFLKVFDFIYIYILGLYIYILVL